MKIDWLKFEEITLYNASSHTQCIHIQTLEIKGEGMSKAYINKVVEIVTTNRAVIYVCSHIVIVS